MHEVYRMKNGIGNRYDGKETRWKDATGKKQCLDSTFQSMVGHLRDFCDPGLFSCESSPQNCIATDFLKSWLKKEKKKKTRHMIY